MKSLELRALPIDCHPVRYVKEYPAWDPYELDDEGFAVRILTTKSSHWEYEREHRFILVGKTNSEYSIDKQAIHSVTLGLRMQDYHKNEINEVLRRQLPHVRLFEATKSSSAFALEFEPVEF